MKDKDARKHALQEIVKYANELTGGRLKKKGEEPVALEIGVMTAEKDDDDKKKPSLREALGL